MEKKVLLEKSDLAKSGLSFILGLLSTTLGFFLALYFNNNIAKKKELATFENLKKGILAEVTHNKLTIDSTFKIHYLDLIFDELTTSSSNQQLTNTIFLNNTDASLLIALQNYIRKCENCNSQKEQLKHMRISGQYDDYLSETLRAFKKSMQETEIAMQNLVHEIND